MQLLYIEIGRGDKILLHATPPGPIMIGTTTGVPELVVVVEVVIVD